MPLATLALALLIAPPPKLFAHYMPWFQAKPFHADWGWHWTMGKRNPDKVIDGKPDIASHYHPIIGPYDSRDPAVTEYHVQLMALAGIDGAFIDWYGNRDVADYGEIHRGTQQFVRTLTDAKLGFSLVYEDRTVPALIKEGAFPADKAEDAGHELMVWLDQNWFRQANYARVDARPLLLNFGPEYYKGEAWNRLFTGLKARPFCVSLDSKQGVADGSFGWPQPSNGTWEANLDSYYQRTKDLSFQIAPAFPRFRDFYGDAGTEATYGKIPDQDGKTFTATLDRAFKSGTPYIQLITWNDWGEGTVIEPSLEFGYRDLEAVQRFRREHIDPKFRFQPADLRLPAALFQLRQRHPADPELSALSRKLLAGKVQEVRVALAKRK